MAYDILSRVAEISLDCFERVAELTYYIMIFI